MTIRESLKAAHDAFDPIWSRGSMTRSEAYRWLSNALGTNRANSHMGRLTPKQRAKVVEVSRAYRGLQNVKE